MSEPFSSAGDQEPSRIIEALLLTAGEPLTVDRLKSLTGIDDAREIRTLVEGLRIEYADTGRAFTIEEVGGGFRILTRPEFAPWLEKLRRRDAEAKLSPAALETLAIVAYRQPVLRAEIEKIRGVDVGAVLRTVAERGLVKAVGRAEEPGNPLLYGTTKRFLSVFGLKNLKELPRLAELKEPS